MTLATFSPSGVLDDITIGYAGLPRCSTSRLGLRTKNSWRGFRRWPGRHFALRSLDRVLAEAWAHRAGDVAVLPLHTNRVLTALARGFLFRS